jgi:hypothetical protein
MSLVLPVAPPGPPGSLAEALAAVPAPRHPRGWRPARSPLPLVGVLQLAVAAMLCGCRRLYAVARWGRDRRGEDPAALVPVGLPVGRSPPHPTPPGTASSRPSMRRPSRGRWGGGWRPAGAIRPPPWPSTGAPWAMTLRGIPGDAVPGGHPVAA